MTFFKILQISNRAYLTPDRPRSDSHDTISPEDFVFHCRTKVFLYVESFGGLTNKRDGLPLDRLP